MGPGRVLALLVVTVPVILVVVIVTALGGEARGVPFGGGEAGVRT